ncbi:MAG: Rho-binding antiterminator, partial [Vibrio sp.]
ETGQLSSMEALSEQPHFSVIHFK